MIFLIVVVKINEYSLMTIPDMMNQAIFP